MRVCVYVCSLARPAVPGISHVCGRQMRRDCGGRVTAERHLALCVSNTLRCVVRVVSRVLCFLCLSHRIMDRFKMAESLSGIKEERGWNERK